MTTDEQIAKMQDYFEQFQCSTPTERDLSQRASAVIVMLHLNNAFLKSKNIDLTAKLKTAEGALEYYVAKDESRSRIIKTTINGDDASIVYRENPVAAMALAEIRGEKYEDKEPKTIVTSSAEQALSQTQVEQKEICP